MQTGAALSWGMAAVVAPAPPLLPTGAGVPQGAPDFLGYGLTTPFRRAANDFAAAAGAPLVQSCIEQCLGTACDSPISSGELPWRTEFGSVLKRLRHLNNNPALDELATAYAQDAIEVWEPRARVTRVTAGAPPTQPLALTVKVRFSLIAANVAGNRVQLPQDLTATVQITGGTANS